MFSRTNRRLYTPPQAVQLFERDMMRHDKVPQSVRDEACRLFSEGSRIKHSDVLAELGIDPDPENKLIWGWLAEKQVRKKVPPVLVVTGPSGNRYARMKGDRGVWGSGRCSDEAIGDVVRSHPEIFGITLEIKPN